MNEMKKFWNDVDEHLDSHSEFILSNDELNKIRGIEQSAYEANIDTIKTILLEFQGELETRDFWTEHIIDKKGLKFRFNKHGYYGPGGCSSVYHNQGRLVLGIINPKGDSHQSYYKNNIEENLEIGLNFNDEKFKDFLSHLILNFVSLSNLIISKDEYEYFRSININN